MSLLRIPGDQADAGEAYTARRAKRLRADGVPRGLRVRTVSRS